MGRPKGSKNKPKVGDVSLNQKGSNPQPVVTVAKRQKSVPPSETPSTTTQPVKSETLSCGSDSVKSVSTPLVDEMPVTKCISHYQLVSGWVNMYKAPDTRTFKNGFYSGSDIHKSKEEAMAHKAHGWVATVPVEFSVKR